MNRTKSIFVVLGISLTMALTFIGCANQKFLIENGDQTIPTYTGTSHFIFWGIGQTNKINPNEICGTKGVSNISTEHTFVDGLLQGITYGIYYPMTYRIYCKGQD